MKRAHCTLPPVDEDRRKTLLSLIDLAQSFSPSDCFDDERAMSLLRSQSTPGELRDLGASESLLEHVFGPSSGTSDEG